jgi:hypothetical protein
MVAARRFIEDFDAEELNIEIKEDNYGNITVRDYSSFCDMSYIDSLSKRQSPAFHRSETETVAATPSRLFGKFWAKKAPSYGNIEVLARRHHAAPKKINV